MSVEVRCPHCGFGNPPGARFCGRCGALLERVPPPRIGSLVLRTVVVLGIFLGIIAVGFAAGFFVLAGRLALPLVASPSPEAWTPTPALTPEPIPEVETPETPEAPATLPAPVSPEPSPPTPPILPSPTSAPSPSPSPEVGSLPRRLAFAVGDPGRSDIYVAEEDGSGIRCLACSPADEAEPDWSPDGREVIFQSNAAGSYDLWIVDGETGAMRPLAITPEWEEREPDWSPAGIVFQRSPRGVSRASGGQICIRWPSGAESCLNIWGRGPAWSPDGSEIAYMAEIGGRWQIFIYNLASGGIFQLTDCLSGCRWPAWSEDYWIGYNELVSLSDFRPQRIYVVRYATEDRPRILVEGNYPGRPAFSSSGWVAFNSDAGIEVVRVSGRDRRVLIPRSRFGGASLWAPVWSR